MSDTTVQEEFNHGEIVDVEISTEMKKSYLDYAMSVIVARAIPDVCDGLKPVHRRIIYSMYESGYDYNKPFKKCARIVGDVMGKYHPHGDSSIYDALVRMAQDFSVGSVLIDGQGNFGSIDDDPPAAMRYTEARMAKLAHKMVEDLDKDTVDFMPNYDGNEKEPIILPTRFPNLLVNGSAGIAVGMATNIPTHNLGEVVDGVIAYINKPDIQVEELLNYIPAPDFPTNCLILGRGGYVNAAKTGRGTVIMRGNATVEEKKNRSTIIIDSIPYQVNKAKLVEQIANLVKEKKIEGISDLRDESSKEGIRIVVDLKKDTNANVILNQLYSFTPLQSNFSINMLALNKGRPELMNLLDVIKAFTNFRKEVVIRRTNYLLQKDRERAHILVGLRVAVSHIDEIIKLIKGSKDTTEARAELTSRAWDCSTIKEMLTLIEDKGNKIVDNKFYFTDIQARAILDMKLSKLTGLESYKIDEELNELANRIKEFLAILADDIKIMNIIKDELIEVKTQFGCPRRSKIIEDESDFDIEDLIPKEDTVIISTVNGYIKRVPTNSYKAQRRGGKGKSGINIDEEDLTSGIFVTDTHTPILFFSNKGKVYRLKAYKIPLGNNNTKGRAIVNLLTLDKDEKITTILPLDSDKEKWINKNIVFATSQGNIRRNKMDIFEYVQTNGKIAIKLDEGDNLVRVGLCDDNDHILLSTKTGKCLRFPIDALRIFQSRSSSGVRGIKLENGNEVVEMSILKDSKIENLEKKDAYLKIPVNERLRIKHKLLEELAKGNTTIMDDDSVLPVKENIDLLNPLTTKEIKQLALDEEFLLTITENGFGKRTSTYEYRITNRGGIGITNILTSKRNGNVITSCPVNENQDIMMITDKGTVIRMGVETIRISGRSTQGVTLMKSQGEKIVSLALVDKEEEEEVETTEAQNQ